MPNTQQTHGHDVLHLILDADPPLTRAQLTTEVQRRFGADARFCTCSADGMTLDQLLGFLQARGKIVERQGKILADAGRMCSHGGEHDHKH